MDIPAEPDHPVTDKRTRSLFLDRGVPEGAVRQVAASALRERIYGSIACLSTLLVISGYDPLQRPWEKAVDVLTATGGLYLASVLSEYVAHIGVHRVPPNRREVRHMLAVSGQIMAASSVPLALLVLAGLHVLQLHTAVWTGIWILVAEMGLFAFVAVRRTDLKWWGELLLVGSLVVLGLLAVLLKTLAH